LEWNGGCGGSRSSVAVWLLGPFRVVRSGTDATPPPSRKVRALIAYLVMAPRPIHRAKLCELLWDVPDDPRGALRSGLTKIRGLLDEPDHKHVKAESEWVSIDTATVEVDALWVAERVAAATSGDDLGLLKQLEAKFEGEFLEGFEADRVPLFEAWLIGERERFQRFRSDVLSRITALLPRTDEALPYIRKRLDVLPFDEAVHRNLLTTLATCGRFAEAEAHLEVATRLFRSQGLNCAALDKAWREHRQLAARETRPKPSPLPVAAPVSVAIEIASAVHALEVKPVPPRLSMVVLPFANISGDPEQEYFVDGVTDSLTTDLSRIRGAFVIARNTAFTFKGKPIDVRAVRRELNVRYALEGSVLRHSDRMRVNVQLVDAESGVHLWAERFDKPIADFFDMQDEIVARLANQLSVELMGSEVRRSERAPAPDSFDLFLRGASWFHRGPTPENLARAQACFEHALTLDPDNVDALVKMSMVDFQYAEFFFSKDRAARLTTAERASVKALRLAPEHARAHLSLGPVLCVTNRVEAGIAECERALAIDPNLAAAHGAIGAFKAHIGRDEETEAHVREALRLSPRDGSVFLWLMFVGGASVNLGRYEEAIVWLSRSIEANRNNPLCHFHLAGTYALLGRLEEARAAARTGLALNPDFTVARFRASPSSNNARFAAAHELFAEALRAAGVPEQ
jgi:TolB-like protein/DNA-binding SARP family transcriptional activator